MKKKQLLLIIVLLIIIIGCMWFFIRKPHTEPTVDEETVGTSIKIVDNRNDYYMVKNCVNKFYSYYASIFENKNPEEEDIEKTYNLLDKKYINFRNITKENIPEILPAINESVVNIYNMYVSQQNENISVYLVKGVLREKIAKGLYDFQILVKVDSTNGTFSVFLQDYVELVYQPLENTLVLDSIEDIEANGNNYYVVSEISEKTYVLDLFEKYKEEALYNTEVAYNNLDKDYRLAKFGNLEKFQKYVKDNTDRYSAAELNEYKKTEDQYICIDKDGYYYIFKEYGVMEYTLLLDTYTVDLPEFLEKYNKAISMDKVGYNIQKVIDAINCKDYEYVYNKLDFEFKAVNYVVIENFEKEIKSKLFKQNEVKEVSSYNEGSVYAFKLTIGDVENKKKEQKMTIIMQLKEGTDFVMSFSFQ